MMDAGTPTHALTILEKFSTGLENDPIPGPNVTVAMAPAVLGRALVADQRPLSGAAVEALPIQCAMSGDAGVAPTRMPDCMPRSSETTTDSTGRFTLALDPGEYVLRVEPVDGTRLPWVWQRVQIPSRDQ